MFRGSLGKEEPDFTPQTNDGKILTLSSLQGKRGAMLVFVATWCSACMAEVWQAKKLVEAARNKGVLGYGVNFKQPEHMVDPFVAGKKVNYLPRFRNSDGGC